MRFVLELWDRFVQVESGRIIDDDAADVEPVETEEAETTIRLPVGFQAPPVTVEGTEDDEEEDATEADCG